MDGITGECNKSTEKAYKILEDAIEIWNEGEKKVSR